MKELKKEMIGGTVYVRSLKQQVKIIPENIELFRRLGMSNLFKNDTKNSKGKRKQSNSNVKRVKRSKSS